MPMEHMIPPLASHTHLIYIEIHKTSLSLNLSFNL